MEIKYPITVYSFGFGNTLNEETFNGPPKHYLDCHSIDEKKNRFVYSSYDVDSYYYLYKAQAVAELKEQIEQDIHRDKSSLTENQARLKELSLIPVH